VTSAARMAVFTMALAGLVVALLWAFGALAPVGDVAGAYGQLLNRVATNERNATDVVTAVNFDYRGFDTLGEEFILFASVAGVAMILRPSRRQRFTREQRDAVEHLPGRARYPTSNAVRLMALAMIGLDVVFGIDIVVHGQLTPGGGFQGGVILASAPLLAYLGGDVPTLRRIAPRPLVAMAEGIGAACFVVIGLVGLLAGAAFLENVVPLGPRPPGVLSSGTIALVSLATGLEVSAGFVLLLLTFVEESLQRTSKGEAGGSP